MNDISINRREVLGIGVGIAGSTAVSSIGTASAQTSTANTDVLMYGGDLENSGVYSAEPITENVGIDWSYDTGERLTSNPIVVDGTLYGSSDSENLYAIDTDSGELEWSYESGLPRAEKHKSGHPTYHNGNVYVAYGTAWADEDHEFDGIVAALDAANGEVVWSRTFGDEDFIGSPVVANDLVYVGSRWGSLYALDVETGETEWQRGGGIRRGLPANSGESLVAVIDENIMRLDATSGDQQWEYNTNDPVQSSPAVDGDKVYIGGNIGRRADSPEGIVYALDFDSGEEEWTFDTGGWVKSDPTVTDDTVFVGSHDDNFYALDKDTGELRWEFSTEGWITGKPAVINDIVYFGSWGGSLYAVDARSGDEIWAIETDSNIRAGPVPAGDALYLSGYDRSFYKIVEDGDPISGSSDQEDTSSSTESGGEESLDDGLLTTGRLAMGGGGLITLLGAYAVLRSSTDDEGNTESAESNSSTEEQSKPTSEVETTKQPSSDRIDTAVTDIRTSLSTAKQAQQNTNYQKAHQANQSAINTAEETLEAADENAPERIEEIEELVDEATQLKQTITSEQELYDSASSTLTRIEKELDNETESIDSGNVTDAQNISQSIEDQLSEVTEILDGTHFSELKNQLEGLKTRHSSLKEQLQDETTKKPIPDTIPAPPRTSLSYTDIKKGDPLGSGGNADVYYATADTGDGTIELALKEPRMSGTIDTDTIEEMLSEAETWQQLDEHDHIVSVISYGSDPLPWIGMEYMDGGDVTDRAGELPIEQAIWTALRTTEAVRHAHDRGVAHFDIKPANILFRTVEDAWDIPKVADWGLSKQLLNHSKSVDGMSPHYAAPEQFDTDQYGKTDNITDIYQLGAVFYELFTGQPPFEGQTFEVMKKIETETPTPPSEIANVPPAVDDILLRALAKEKNNRYEHVLYLRDDLRTLWNETK